MNTIEPHPPEGDHKADRRVREVYRYFQPTNPAALNPTWLPFGAEVTATTTPLQLPTDPPETTLPAALAAVDPLDLNSPNTTLTAFAQLVALRLNARRALISVLDRESQFILAEATQSLNLADPTSFIQSTDGLWAGCSKVAHAWTVCKDTVTLRRDKENGRPQLLIVNDLSAHDRYKRLPFVQGDPHFRFYAGTPLTTANGLNIGCIFVLDSEPREHGLTDVEQDHLGTVATLVIDYLRISRQASEGRRAARLSRGLSCFVDGSSSFVDSANPSRASSSTPGTSAAALSTTPPSITQRTNPSSAHSRTSPRSTRRSPASRHSSVDAGEGMDPSSRSQSADDASVGSGSGSEGKAVGSAGTGSDLTTPLPDWWTDPNGKGVPLDDINSNSWAFRRAANLLRESLELDGDGGVIFIEASNGPTLDGDNNSVYTGETSNPAPVLAVSTNDEPFAPQSGSRSHSPSYSRCPAANIDRAFLQQLLRRYPKGKLWSFHRDGSVATSDEDEKSAAPLPGASHPIDMSKNTTKKWRASENSSLNTYFPHANQVMFVPLWNAASSQWYAGCFCWTAVETHVFSSAVELSAVLGFASSVMAECSRVESLIADRQKGDFIGSISHELRSPLHGILAAAEFLDSTALNEFQGSLLETINACGRTLLDTMNQVLDFSKIMSLERTWRQLKRNKETTPLTDLKTVDKVSAHLDTYTWTDLAILAEEVVEGVCLGHSYGQRSTASGDQTGPGGVMSPQLGVQSGSETSDVAGRNDVEVVVDIVHQDWVYKTQPGALRRIIMNVFGNAMKYTDKGRVSIRLESVERSEGRSRRQGLQDLVTLTVTDTGKGISEEFLRGRLYTPFAQEDTLAVGTGLGLSIVRSIVKALNGSISVHSRPGEGTMVKVSLPLIRPAGEDSPPLIPHAELLQQRDASVHALHLREAFRGRRVAILGYHPDSAGDSLSWTVVAQYLTDWYELELVPWPAADGSLDLLLADEGDLTPGVVLNGTSTSSGAATPLPALLIFCHKSIDYSSACSEWSSFARTVEILRRPCGPYKLAKSILKCLRGGTSTANASRSPSPGQSLASLPHRPRRETITTMATMDSSSSSPHLSVPLAPATSSSQLVMSDAHSGSDSSLPTLDSTRSVSGTPHSSISSASTNVTQPSPGSISEISSRKPRVLVVDDNSINLHLMLTFMRKRNLDVLDSAENGQLAVDAVERMQQGYDLIFMDMSMPVMNGFEATRAIRSLEKDRDGRDPVTIIALTGLSSSRDESEALASGVDLFLTKPVSFKEVSRLLDEWEEKYQRQQQHRRAATAAAAAAGGAAGGADGIVKGEEWSTTSTTPPSEPLPSPEEEVEEEGLG